MKPLHVLLINPGTINRYYHARRSWADTQFLRYFRAFYDRKFQVPTHAHCTTVPPLTLFGLRALLRERCVTGVVDEQVEPIDFGASADLVCINATTRQITRAIEISARFRTRGIPTALGGVHATCMPDECAPHFDVVCVGEAEDYLDQLLDDLEGGTLKPRYVAHSEVPMSRVPFFDYQIGGGHYLPFHFIDFSRGCIYNCEFCSIQSTVGSFRAREVDEVVREIERVGSRNLFFTDATLTADPRKARELFRALIPLKVRWLGQISLNVAVDRDMVDLMAESGCWLASTGFESLSEKNLRHAGKSHNRVAGYADVIEAFHQRGIAMEGNFVFGFDDDCDDVFDNTARFVIQAGVDLPQFHLLTPYPDTALYRRLQAEGRIVDRDWSHYDNASYEHLPVFRPKRLSREALREGIRWTERTVFSWGNTFRRLARARVFHAPVLIANYVYASRIARLGTLLPVEPQQ